VRIEQERLEARRLMVIAEEKHEILIGAARDRKILDKLKEKRRLQYQEWLKQLEAKQLDDQTMTRIAWRKP
jgi:flagellar FliJ protein